LAAMHTVNDKTNSGGAPAIAKSARTV